MAHDNYRPDYEYLRQLGFVETDSGETHPYDRWNELQLNQFSFLEMDAFWDFGIRIGECNRIPVLFSGNEELENFIDQFKE